MHEQTEGQKTEAEHNADMTGLGRKSSSSRAFFTKQARTRKKHIQGEEVGGGLGGAGEVREGGGGEVFVLKCRDSAHRTRVQLKTLPKCHKEQRPLMLQFQALENALHCSLQPGGDVVKLLEYHIHPVLARVVAHHCRVEHEHLLCFRTLRSPGLHGLGERNWDETGL